MKLKLIKTIHKKPIKTKFSFSKLSNLLKDTFLNINPYPIVDKSKRKNEKKKITILVISFSF